MPRLTADSLDLFKARVGRLEPGSRPRWGRMDAGMLVRHLRRALEISLGEVEAPDRSIPVLRWVLWILFFHVFTLWPPSRARLPEVWLPPAEDDFPVEKQRLVQALDRFVRGLERQPQQKAVHTLVGPLTLRSWSRAHGVHFRHHFRQFGLTRLRDLSTEP